jgi:hypothetical protein
MKGETLKMEREEEYRPSKFRTILNLYGGMAIGAVAPTVALRYTLFRDSPPVVGWIMAASSNLCPVLPIAGAAVGFTEGYLGLRDLIRKKNEKLRRQRESELEDLK